MAAALDLPDLSGAGLVGLAVLAVVLLYRSAGLLAHVAVWLVARVRGPDELYADHTPPGGTVGRSGTARTDLAPRGKVFVRGELWDAESEGPVAAGEPVVVIGTEGMVLRVRPAAGARRS